MLFPCIRLNTDTISRGGRIKGPLLVISFPSFGTGDYKQVGDPSFWIFVLYTSSPFGYLLVGIVTLALARNSAI